MADTAFHPSRTTGVVLIAAIFVMGIAFGAALFYLGQRSVLGDAPIVPPPGIPGDGPPIHGPLGAMARELQLDDAQRQEVRQILERYRGRIHLLLEESRLEIRNVLTEEQRQRFDTMRPPRREGHGRPGMGRGFRQHQRPPGDPQGDPPPPPPPPE